MSDEEQYIDLPDDRSPSEKEHDEQLDKLDQFFRSLEPGATLLIERIQPSWCSGLLEEVYVGDESIDLDYFISTWGGKLLCVKTRNTKGQLSGRYRIPLNSFPPLVYGEPIQRATPLDHLAVTKKTGGETPSSVVVNPPPIQQNGVDFEAIMKMMQAQQAQQFQQMQLMLQLMKPTANNGVADFTKMAAGFAQMQELFKSKDAGEVGELEFIPQALEVLKMALDKPKQPQTQQITGPKVKPLPESTRASSPVTPIRKASLSDSIAALEPEKAAQTLIEAIGKMPSDKRDQAFQAFLSDFQETMGDDLEEETADEKKRNRGS